VRVEFCGGGARVLLAGDVARVLLLAGGGEKEGQQGANSPPSPHQHSTPLVSATKQKMDISLSLLKDMHGKQFLILFAKAQQTFVEIESLANTHVHSTLLCD
jgi:hypothetical protein